MSFDSIITLVGVFIAVISLIPKSKLLIYQIQLSWRDKIIFITLLLCIVYLLFYDTFTIIFSKPVFITKLSVYGIYPSNLISILVTIACLYLYLKFKFPKLNPMNRNKINKLINNFLQERKYRDLIEFLESNYQKINQIDNCETPYLKFSKKICDFIHNKATSDSKVSLCVFGKVKAIPCFSGKLTKTNNLINNMITNEMFLKYIVEVNSYVFLNFFSVNNYSRQLFVEFLFDELLKNKRSILYHELYEIQNYIGYHKYTIHESNKLIHYLLSSLEVTVDLELWDIVGGFVNAKLDFLSISDNIDYYNTNDSLFRDKTCWKSDIFICIHFLDIMVSTVLRHTYYCIQFQHYYVDFVQKIVKNHSYDIIDIEEVSEWPTNYEYLLYVMFNNMKIWIMALKENNPGKLTLPINFQELLSTSSNSSIHLLDDIGTSLRILVNSLTISVSFKRYILKIIFDLYFTLREDKNLSNYSVVLAKSIYNPIESKQETQKKYFLFIDDCFNKHFKKHSIKEIYKLEFEIIMQTKGHTIPLEHL